MESKQKFVKAKFKDAKKIISFTESFEGFLKSLETSFKIALCPLELSSFSIAYLDDEEDLINIENPFDYQEALKFAENSNQNFLNFLISLKNQSFANLPFKKDNKETFEFIETNSLRSQELQKSPQIEFLIPKGQKADLNTIQKLEDLKFYVDENQINHMSKKILSKKNFMSEDTILSKSPEISIDLPKQLIDRNTQENFEITYDSSNNSQKKDKNKEKAMKIASQSNEVRNETNFKLEKNPKKKSEKKTEKKKEKENEDESRESKENLISEKNKIFNCIKLNSKKESKENKEKKEQQAIKKEAKTIAKTLAKKAINEELRLFRKEVEAEITAVISKHYGKLLQKNLEAQKKLSEMQDNISKLNTLSNAFDLGLNAKKAHLGFSCRSCKQEPLVGIRYKCSVCKDFDICEACEETSAQAHPHPFIKIRSQELNPAFIKTILFEHNNNSNDTWSNNNTSNTGNNAQDKNRYIEKYIDLDYNPAFSGNNNNNLNSYNCFNLEANNQMLNYLKHSGLNYLLNPNIINNNNNNNTNTNNHNISNCSSANSNFNINNLIKPSNFTNFISNNNNNNNNLNKNPSTAEDKYQITCLNASEVFEIKNSKAKEFKVSLKLKNSGRLTIPRPCYLECVSSQSEISGKGIPIDLSLKPGMSVNLEVTLDIAGLRKGLYLSVWRMQTSQREFFGEEIPLKIKIEKTEDLKIKDNYVEKNLNPEINSDEKISFNELLRRNKISEIDLPLKSQKSLNSNINNSVSSDVNSSFSSQQQSKIISLEEFKKLKLLKQRKSEGVNAEKVEANNIRVVQKETKDFFALADEIIKKHPHMNINRKLLVNALFRTGGNEKNSIEMATNETHNVCGHYNKHKFN